MVCRYLKCGVINILCQAQSSCLVFLECKRPGRWSWSWMELDPLSSLLVWIKALTSVLDHSCFTVGTLYTFNKDKIAQRGSRATGEERNYRSWV